MGILGSKFGVEPGDPARECFVITPHNTNAQNPVPKSIRADGDGVIVLRAVDSSVDVPHPVVKGERIDVYCQFIRVTGTTGQMTIIGYK